MIDFILDIMEENGVYLNDPAEYRTIIEGIRLYLHENGIAIDEEREYFRKYIKRHMALIDPEDMKAYFNKYSEISRVRQIAIECQRKEQIDVATKAELYRLMAELGENGLGNKYIPEDEIRAILGTRI